MKHFAIFAAIIVCALPLPAQNDVAPSLRASLTLNGDSWQFVTNQPQSPIPTSGWAPMRAPSAPWMDGTTSVWYEQTIFIPQSWVVPGRRFFLELEKCGHYCAIYVNGQLAGDHYGQFAPYEAEVTSGIVGGQSVTFQIYAHIADDTYTRRGANLNQEASCGSQVPLCESASYRPQGLTPNARNWVGITGDITFSWRGRNSEYLASVQIITSYRNSTITANVAVIRASPNATVSASVFDANGNDVLDLPAALVVNGAASLQMPWSTAVPWSQANPQLYQLETTLNDPGTLDQRFDRFGFREVWADGTSLLLNGSPVWVVGTFLAADSDLRWSNARDAISMQLYEYQASGLNGDTYHWDDAGREWSDLRDEMGELAIDAMYCNGPPDPTDSKVDSASAWLAFMQQQAAEVAAAEQNHPSNILWRPFDVVPSGAGGKPLVDPQIKAAMIAVNPTLLFADGSDVQTWAQPVEYPGQTTCDNGSEFAAWLAQQTTPSLIREIYGGYGLSCLKEFYETIYQEAYDGGAVGIIVQQLGVASQDPFTPIWPSQSGIGNRPEVTDLPNWISRQWTPTLFGIVFLSLYKEFTGQTPAVGSPADGEYLASGITGPGFLLPPSSFDYSAVGVLAAEDGTAWFVTEKAGANLLDYAGTDGDVETPVDAQVPAPF